MCAGLCHNYSEINGSFCLLKREAMSMVQTMEKILVSRVLNQDHWKFKKHSTIVAIA